MTTRTSQADDPFHLQRFLLAQDDVIDDVLSELRQARKTSHWMWFIFPQLKGLGHSSMAERFGISSTIEAHAYLAYPVLGPRLVECTALVNAVEDRSVEQIFGSTDAMKFRSSMTLFAHAAPYQTVFSKALDKYFAGRPDALTLSRL